jgi:signal transduction histidine kinase
MTDRSQTPQRLSRFLATYRGKLLLALFFVDILLLPLLFINRISLTRSFIFQRVNTRIGSMGQLLVDEVQENIMDNDSAEIAEILTLASLQEQIEFVLLLDESRAIRYAAGGTDRTGLPYQDDPAISDRARGNLYVTSLPVVENPAGITALQIGYSLTRARRDLLMSTLWAILIDIIIVLGVLGIAWIISGLLMRPLYVMKDAARKIAGGDFAVRVEARSGDEIQALAEALNDMAEQLDGFTRGLQDRIREATRNLETSNRALAEESRKLAESNQRLQELDVLKSDFVSMVSHELRTPLTSIIGFAKTLRSLELDDEQRVKYAQIIEREGKRLGWLIEEYLDLSKIEAGNFGLNLRQVAVGDLILETIQSLSGRFKNPIVVRFFSELPTVEADPERLRQVLINLIDNACSYSPPESEVTVMAKLVDSAVTVCVQDKGPGIHEEERQRVFEKFYRRQEARTRRPDGSGLGLTIAKGIVEAHSGTIWIETSDRTGTAICFSIPARIQSRDEAVKVDHNAQ